MNCSFMFKLAYTSMIFLRLWVFGNNLWEECINLLQRLTLESINDTRNKIVYIMYAVCSEGHAVTNCSSITVKEELCKHLFVLPCPHILTYWPLTKKPQCTQFQTIVIFVLSNLFSTNFGLCIHSNTNSFQLSIKRT